MRKIFKKIVTVVAAAAMMVGTIAGMPTTEAKAATNVVLNFKLPSDWTADTTGVNIWGGAAITDSTGEVNKPAAWGAGTLPKVNDAGSGWVSVTIDDASKVQGIQFVSTDYAAFKEAPDDDGNLWNATINSLELTSAYYDTDSKKWYKDAALTQEVVAPTLDDIYYVAGAQALVGADWAATDAKGLMTADGDNFSITFTGIAKGSYEFKVLQDPADFAWDNAYVGEVKAGDNGLVTVATDNSKVTISINKTTKVVTTTVVAPTGEVQEPETTTAAETVASHNVTVKVTVDSSLAWEKVYLYSWTDAGNNGEWPGTEMTKDGDVYTLTLSDVDTATMNMIVNNGDGKQTIDISNISVAGDTVEINVTAQTDAEGKYVATSSQQATVTTADTTPVVAVVVAMAVLGLAVVAMNAKKVNR